MTFDADTVVARVTDFCERRHVAAGSEVRIVASLDEAFDILRRKGPDNRWKTVATKFFGDDFPASALQYPSTTAERAIFDDALRRFDQDPRRRLVEPKRGWWLSHCVVSASHWARFCQTMREAYEFGLGWTIPANKDVLVVLRPILRCAPGSPAVLHDDTGQMAVEWPDGTGSYFLRGVEFDVGLYFAVVRGELSLDQVAKLADADQRSTALGYMGFQQLVASSNVRMLDRGNKGTALYSLRLPLRIARDRVRGYGGFDYFIHMRDASHPEREFIEWVDPKIGALGDAELCQAHAFGITLEQWLSIEQEG